MAKVVRKVSNKNVRGQKKSNNIFKNKIFISIVAVVVLAGIGLGIFFGVKNANKKKASEVETFKDHFVEAQSYNNAEVNFTKTTYAGIKLHANANNDKTHVDNIFVFAVDISKFYPKEFLNADDEDLKDESHEKIFADLIKLQYAIDNYNKTTTDKKTALYIVDIKSGTNSSAIVMDETYGGSEQEALPCMFSYINVDGVVKTYDKTSNGKTEKKDIYSCRLDNSMQTAINNAITFMNNNFKDEE